MDTDLIETCLLELGLAGISVNKKSIKLFSKEIVSSDRQVLTLLLDSQEFIAQPGRFALFKFDSEHNLLFFSVLECLPGSDVRLLVLHSHISKQFVKLIPDLVTEYI